MRFKIEKIMDEYYSDRTYVVVKLAIIDSSFSGNFEEGKKINISKAKE